MEVALLSRTTGNLVGIVETFFVSILLEEFAVHHKQELPYNSHFINKIRVTTFPNATAIGGGSSNGETFKMDIIIASMKHSSEKNNLLEIITTSDFATTVTIFNLFTPRKKIPQ